MYHCSRIDAVQFSQKSKSWAFPVLYVAWRRGHICFSPFPRWFVITDGCGLSIRKAKCNVSVCLLSTKPHNKESLLSDALALVSLTAFSCFHKRLMIIVSPTGLNQHLNAMNVLTCCSKRIRICGTQTCAQMRSALTMTFISLRGCVTFLSSFSSPWWYRLTALTRQWLLSH